MNPNEASTEALAYLGDCVIELRVRKFLVSCGMTRSAKLNSSALDFVKAGAQSEAVHNILDMLDDDEAAAFRRGRNIGHTNTPKSATALQYRQATGMEALFGYLELCGKSERADELFAAAYADTITKYKENINEQPQNQI